MQNGYKRGGNQEHSSADVEEVSCSRQSTLWVWGIRERVERWAVEYEDVDRGGDKEMGRKKAGRVVSSKIEITKSTEKPAVDGRSLSLQQYHSEVNEMGKKIEKFALSLGDNLLSIKMALMQAVRTVERKMKENR